MRPPPVYPPEPQREGGLYNREEVEGVLIERAYQQLIRHPSYGRVWNMQPVVRAHARLVKPEKPHCSRSSAQIFGRWPGSTALSSPGSAAKSPPACSRPRWPPLAGWVFLSRR